MRSLKERLKEQRLDRDALRKGILPLSAFYGRDPDFEDRRNHFYAAMEKAYRRDGTAKEEEIDMRAGRDGRPAEIASIGRERAMPVITNSAPLEYLFSKGMLQTKDDTHGAAYRRLSAGQRLRSVWEGAQISGLKAANFEGSSGGGAPGRLPGEYKMDCIRWLSELRGHNQTPGLEQSQFSMVEDLVFHDIWLWEKVRADRREKVILKLLKALDDLSVRFHMMEKRDFNARWYPARRSEAEQGSPDQPLALHPEEPSAPMQSETPPTGSEL